MTAFLLCWCLATVAPEPKPLPPPERRTGIPVSPLVRITRNGVPCHFEDIREDDEVRILIEDGVAVEVLIEGKDP